MPQMGESIFEGTITKWLKKVGDTVEKDEPLFEISTDKVDAEIPSPVAGVLTEIKVRGRNGSDQHRGCGDWRQRRRAGEAAASAARPFRCAKAACSAPECSRRVTTDAARYAGPRPGRALRSSPLVRRIAKENNLDLAQDCRHGFGGRITKEDVLQAT